MLYEILPRFNKILFESIFDVRLALLLLASPKRFKIIVSKTQTQIPIEKIHGKEETLPL